MRPFEFYAPTKYKFGPDVASQIGPDLAAGGFQKALIVYGQGSAVRSGLLGTVTGALSASGVEHIELSGVRPNPEVASVRAGIDLVRAQAVDVVVAIGGGSVIDCAKAIAFGSLYVGDVWDFFSGKAKPQEALPIAVVLTIPAAGSEGSSSCVISNDDLGAKNGTAGDCFRPKLAYLDPQVTYMLPAYQTAAGVTDMIAHVCERFFSGAEDVPVTDNIACGIVRALLDAAPKALANPQDYDARATIMWCGTLAHNDIAGCGRALGPGRAGGWESHALEHAMSALDTNITHGAGLAVIMPAWMRHVVSADPARFALFGHEVFGLEGEDDQAVAYEAINRLQAFFTSLGMPATMDELGLSPADVGALVDKVVKGKGESFGHFAPLERDDVRAIYESAFA